MIVTLVSERAQSLPEMNMSLKTMRTTNTKYQSHFTFDWAYRLLPNYLDARHTASHDRNIRIP
jgi:hypothetical protein